MIDRRLFVEIEVAGNATKIFREIGQSAKTAAQDVMQSGDRAKQGVERIEKAADGAEKQVEELEVAQKKAAKAADEMAQHSDRAGKSLDRYKDAIGRTQIGLAALGTAFTMYANQQRDHERTLIAVERMYGEAAKSYVDFANQIQNTSIFSNDQALEAARIMGVLREQYALSDSQVQQLIQTSADLASIHGVSLVDAAQRVQSAIRGESESAEALGLSLQQSAIDAEGLTLSMSNAEAAQFRFNAMMDQTGSSVGAAAEVAKTTTGQVQQLSNQFQDAMTSVVAFTGPVGQAAGGLTSFGAEAGFLVTGLGALAPVAAKAALAIRGLSLASLGPAGLVIGLGAVTVAAWKYFDSLGDNGITGRMNDAATAGDTLAQSIARVSHEMANATLGLDLFGDLETLTGETKNAVLRLEELKALWPTVAAGGMPTTPITIPGGKTFEQAKAEWEELIALQQRLGDVSGSTLAEVNAAYNEIVTNTLPGHEAALETAMNIMDSFQSGEITLAQLRDQLNGVIADFENYAKQALETSEANKQIASSTNDATAVIDKHVKALQDYLALTRVRPDDGIEPEFYRMQRVFLASKIGMDSAALAMLGLDENARKLTRTLADFPRPVEQGTRAIADLGGQLTQLTADTKAVDMARLIDDFEAAMHAASGLSESMMALQAGGGSVSLDLAINTSGASQALQSGFGAAVGGAQGLGQIAQQTAEWSGSLAHAAEGMAADQTELNALLQKGAITQTTYNRALDANHRIQQANASVQEDVLRIQAKQLPVMAELAEEHARYVDQLADADVATQTVALGYMDTTKASQAMALATLASTAAMAGMEGVAAETITAMAAADPVLKAMLIDMGLIREGATGKIEMNTDDALSATDVLTTLNGTISDLNILLSKIFNVDITATDNASGTISHIEGLLNQLDGKTASVYINTLGGNTIGFTDGAATGTTILPDHHTHADYLMPRGIVARVDGMSTGGHLRLVGEAGPELVQLPTGSTVTNAAGTRGRLDPQGRGRRSAGGGDVYNGTVHMTVVRDDSALTHRQRELAKRRR